MSNSKIKNNPKKNKMGVVLLASTFGTIIEFFDTAIVSTAAVLIFPLIFFPKQNEFISAILPTVIFAIAFLSRPVGGILFGHIGDTKGRKQSFTLSLLVMGFATTIIGILPSWSSIGILAPIMICLCRFAQGVGIGGEATGGIIYAIENSDKKKQAWYGMFPNLGAPVGIFLSSVILGSLSTNLTTDAFNSWGWRIPFLASTLLILIALFVRFKLVDTPEFTKIAKKKRHKYPVLKAIRSNYREILLITFTCALNGALMYLISVFLMYYANNVMNINKSTFLSYLSYGSAFCILGVFVAGLLSRKYSLQIITLVSSLLAFIYGLYFNNLLASGSATSLLIAVLIGMFICGINGGASNVLATLIFPTSVRFSGSALGAHLSNILGSSFTPIVAVYLFKQYNLSAVGYYIAVVALISFFPLLIYYHKQKNATAPISESS